MSTPERKALQSWMEAQFDAKVGSLGEMNGFHACEGVGLYCAAFAEEMAEQLRDDDSTIEMAKAGSAYFRALSAPGELNTSALVAAVTAPLWDYARAALATLYEQELSAWLATAAARRRVEAETARYEMAREIEFMEQMI